MDPITIGISALGIATSIYGLISGSNAQAEAAERDAKYKRAEAAELLERQKINEEIMTRKSRGLENSYANAFASTGREGAGIGGMIQIHSELEENLALSRREANFKAAMLRAGANESTTLASDAMTAGYISGAGTLLTGAARTYELAKPGSTKSLYGGS